MTQMITVSILIRIHATTDKPDIVKFGLTAAGIVEVLDYA